MTDLGYTFDETVPAGTDPASSLDTYIADGVKKAVNERYELEHVALDDAEINDASNATAGRHKPGFVSCLYRGTAAAFQALSNKLGAIAYETDTGQVVVDDGASGKHVIVPANPSFGTVQDSDTTLLAGAYQDVNTNTVQFVLTRTCYIWVNIGIKLEWSNLGGTTDITARLFDGSSEAAGTGTGPEIVLTVYNRLDTDYLSWSTYMLLSSGTHDLYVGAKINTTKVVNCRACNIHAMAFDG